MPLTQNPESPGKLGQKAALACTCFRVRRLARAVSRLYDQNLAIAGIKTTQYSLLAQLANRPSSMTMLAQYAGLERTTLTRNLQPILMAGWAAIVPARDARKKTITLTPAGREKLREAGVAWRRAQLQLQQTLGDDTVASFNDELDRMVKQITPLLEAAAHEAR